MHAPSAPLFVALLLVGGCGARAVDEVGEIDAVVEVLAEGGVTGAVATEGHRVLVGGDDGIALLVAGEPAVALAGAAGPPLAAAVHDGEVLVLTDDGLAVVSAGQLASTPLADALDGPPSELSAAGGALWLRTGAGVWLVRDGALSAVSVEGRVMTGPVAAGVTPAGEPFAWVGGEGRLLAVDAAGGVLVDRALAVEDLAVDRTGRAWVVSDGELVAAALDGPWRRYALPEALVAVAADPGAEGAWLATGAAVYRVAGAESGEVFEVLAGEGAPAGMAADPLGRLLAWDGDLRRVTAGRVIEVLGLEDGARVDDGAVVTLLPTAPDEVASVKVTVDGTPLDVTAEPDGTWTADVDALAWAGEGTRSLVATADYTGGQAASSGPVRFTVGSLGEVTWAEHVEPLHVAHCAVCHAGDTATVLEDAATWQARVEDILAQVEAGNMPLGADPLGAGEIAVIRGWRDGGFSP